MTQATSTFNDRLEQAKDIRSKNIDFYRIGGGLALIFILILIGSSVFGDNLFGFAETMLGYVTNVVTEALSVIATILVIDQLNQRRERNNRKVALFRQTKSRSNDFAIDAISQIRDEGWWDGLLEHYTIPENRRVDLSQVQWAGGVNLSGVELERARLTLANLQRARLVSANLQEANLGGANLQETDLVYANLQETDLVYANLQRAHLRDANLQGADLGYANLQEAILEGANLQQADLFGANLQQADLFGANLQQAILYLANLQQANLERANLQGAILGGVNLQHTTLVEANLQGANLLGANLQHTTLVEANLQGAKINESTQFDEKTVLPDANFVSMDENGLLYDKYWTPETDMTRYTDPNHTDFWQPNWAKSDTTE